MPALQLGRDDLVGDGHAAGLLERDAELARVEQAVLAVSDGHGSALIIEGTAGIGKSSLLRAVCEQACEHGLQTLTARVSELERDFGFGIVRQLLERRLVRAGEAQRSELLTGAAALAGPVLGLAGKGGDSFAALHGLYWLVANLAASGPLVLAVDDLQWADEPSLRWLVYLCHRLEGLPVLVAATTRPLRPGHCQLLAELLAVASAQILCPGPLSEPAVARLIHDGLDAVPDPAFVTACASASGGNPFVVRELIFDLAADGVAPVAAQATSVTARVPGQVERTVLARLRRLDGAATRLAEAVAVLGEGTGLRLAAAMANLDIDAAAAAADALLTAELFDEGRRCSSCIRWCARRCTSSSHLARAPRRTRVPRGCSSRRAPIASRSVRSCCCVSRPATRRPSRYCEPPQPLHWIAARPGSLSPTCAGHWPNRLPRNTGLPCWASWAAPNGSPAIQPPGCIWSKPGSRPPARWLVRGWPNSLPTSCSTCPTGRALPLCCGPRWATSATGTRTWRCACAPTPRFWSYSARTPLTCPSPRLGGCVAWPRATLRPAVRRSCAWRLPWLSAARIAIR